MVDHCMLCAYLIGLWKVVHRGWVPMLGASLSIFQSTDGVVTFLCVGVRVGQSEAGNESHGEVGSPRGS